MKNLRKYLSPVLLLILFSTGCKKEKGITPVVLSLPAANINTSTATSGGNIINDGSIPVSSSGVCWSTDPNPTLQNSKTTDGSGIGKYISSITGLTPGTTYFLRSYATNAAGTSYGAEESFTTTNPGSTVSDIDGNIYGIVTIGNQVWMKENLRTTRYSNGDSIPTSSPGLSLTTQPDNYNAYQWPVNGKESWTTRYGRLYTWFAATDTRKICPVGWHLPSNSEWSNLSAILINKGEGFNGSNLIAKSLAASTDWAVSSISGSVGYSASTNNSSGFEGLPAGYRMIGSGGFYDGFGKTICWWSTNPGEYDYTAWLHSLFYSDGTLSEFVGDKSIGGSIRCLKD
jgi:uncharacterized protein (TIGR02145 family)